MGVVFKRRSSRCNERWIPEFRWSSREVPWSLFGSADPAVSTRGSVILTFRAQSDSKIEIFYTQISPGQATQGS